MVLRFAPVLLAMAAPLVPQCASPGHVNTTALTSFPAVTCLSSATCVAGDVCCATLGDAGGADFARCQPEPCATEDVQLCQDSAECVSQGFACGPGLALPDGGSTNFCTPPVDAGIAAQTVEAGACAYPAGVVVSSPSGPGCFGGPARNICQVSNGAIVNANGSVTNGTESCSSICNPGEFEMTCSDTSMSPDPSLGCTIIPIPTPSCCLYYCCPCGQ